MSAPISASSLFTPVSLAPLDCFGLCRTGESGQQVWLIGLGAGHHPRPSSGRTALFRERNERLARGENSPLRQPCDRGEVVGFGQAKRAHAHQPRGLLGEVGIWRGEERGMRLRRHRRAHRRPGRAELVPLKAGVQGRWCSWITPKWEKAPEGLCCGREGCGCDLIDSRRRSPERSIIDDVRACFKRCNLMQPTTTITHLKVVNKSFLGEFANDLSLQAADTLTLTTVFDQLIICLIKSCSLFRRGFKAFFLSSC